MQPIKYRQQQWWGCGSFSLANLFDDHRFLEDLPTGHGERTPDLNRKMAKFQRALFIDNIFLTNFNLKEGSRLSWANRELLMTPRQGLTKEMKEVLCVPYMVAFSRANGGAHNILVLHNLKDNLYYLVDSCKPEVERMTIRQMISKLPIVAVAVFRYWKHEDIGNMLFAPKSELAHIFTPED